MFKYGIILWVKNHKTLDNITYLFYKKMKAKPAPLYVICFLVANHPKMYYLNNEQFICLWFIGQQFELNSAQRLLIYLSITYLFLLHVEHSSEAFTMIIILPENSM